MLISEEETLQNSFEIGILMASEILFLLTGAADQEIHCAK